MIRGSIILWLIASVALAAWEGAPWGTNAAWTSWESTLDAMSEHPMRQLVNALNERRDVAGLADLNITRTVTTGPATNETSFTVTNQWGLVQSLDGSATGRVAMTQADMRAFDASLKEAVPYFASTNLMTVSDWGSGGYTNHFARDPQGWVDDYGYALHGPAFDLAETWAGILDWLGLGWSDPVTNMYGVTTNGDAFLRHNPAGRFVTNVLGEASYTPGRDAVAVTGFWDYQNEPLDTRGDRYSGVYVVFDTLGGSNKYLGSGRWYDSINENMEYYWLGYKNNRWNIDPHEDPFWGWSPRYSSTNGLYSSDWDTRNDFQYVSGTTSNANGWMYNDGGRMVRYRSTAYSHEHYYGPDYPWLRYVTTAAVPTISFTLHGWIADTNDRSGAQSLIYTTETVAASGEWTPCTQYWANVNALTTDGTGTFGDVAQVVYTNAETFGEYPFDLLASNLNERYELVNALRVTWHTADAGAYWENRRQGWSQNSTSWLETVTGGTHDQASMWAGALTHTNETGADGTVGRHSTNIFFGDAVVYIDTYSGEYSGMYRTYAYVTVHTNAALAGISTTFSHSAEVYGYFSIGDPAFLDPDPVHTNAEVPNYLGVFGDIAEDGLMPLGAVDDDPYLTAKPHITGWRWIEYQAESAVTSRVVERAHTIATDWANWANPVEWQYSNLDTISNRGSSVVLDDRSLRFLLRWDGANGFSYK